MCSESHIDPVEHDEQGVLVEWRELERVRRARERLPVDLPVLVQVCMGYRTM